MTPKTKLRWLLIVCASICVTIVAYFTGKPSGKVRVVVRPTIDSLISIHGSPDYSLRVCGTEFRNLVGLPPFWMSISNTDLILFAYRDAADQRVLVICNTNSCTFDLISLFGVRFGDHLGRQIVPPQNWGDTVEPVRSNKVVLVSVGFKYVERSILDLDEKSITVTDLKDERAPPLELPY